MHNAGRLSLGVAALGAWLMAAPLPAAADQSETAPTDLADPSVSQHTPEFRPLMDMPPDQGFITQLLLMQSHMRAGMALYDAGVRDQATAHCSHPLEELYDDLALQLDERGLPPFGAVLRAVVDDLHADKPRAEILAAADRATTAIEVALESVDPSVRDAPAFVVAVATGLLRSAERDYDASLVEGSVANLIEYQDSRAFLEQAHMLVAAQQAPLAARDAAAFAELQKRLADLDRLIPAQPSTEAVGLDQVVAIVDRVDLLQAAFR